MAAPILIKLLGDPVPFCRGHAAIALAEIGAVEALSDVERAADKETHEKMKGVIAAALNLLRMQQRGAMKP
jgi:HEAT repeat protein